MNNKNLHNLESGKLYKTTRSLVYDFGYSREGNFCKSDNAILLYINYTKYITKNCNIIFCLHFVCGDKIITIPCEYDALITHIGFKKEYFEKL